MAKRILTSVVGLPILIALIILGGIYLKIGIAIISVIGLFEFYKTVNDKILPIHYAGFTIATLYILSLDLINDTTFKMIIMAFVLLLLIIQVFMHQTINIHHVTATLFGFFYIPFMFANIFLIRNSIFGIYTVWLIFISAFCCDTGAYFVGMSMGKHKLAPILSPKKTIEGAVGGVLCAGGCAAIYGQILTQTVNTPNDVNLVVVFFIIGIIGSVFAELGDLAASSIKRFTGIKDYGTIFPGHGGVLDRFDSVIFTSAVVYLASLYFLKF